MENIVLIIIGLAIIYQGYMIFKSQRKLKYDMKKMKDDYNIEFGATEGSGIEVVKKQYPELVDDWRQKVESKEPHSISAGMNDSCREHKAEYPDGK